MLRGFYREGDITVCLDGYDMSDTMVFYLSCPLHETRKVVDKGITISDEDGGLSYYPPKWDKLYFSVGSGFANISCFTEKENNVIYKNEINTPFFRRMGSLIRGMKMSCYTSNREDELDILSNEFIPKKILKYIIPNKDGSLKGTVDMEMCNVIRMEVGSDEDDIQLLLEEDYSYDLKVNKITSKHHKIALDLSDYVIEKEDDSWDLGNLDDDIFSLADIIEKNPHKSYIWLNDRKYHVVTDMEDVKRICKEIWAHKGIVSFDTETTGLNFTFKCRQGLGDRLVGMVFSIREGEAWYFPVAHKKVKNICIPENENYIIEKYFRPLLEKKDILAHNGSFDWKVMYTYGIFLNLVHDTYIIYKLSLWNDNRGLGLGLKNLAHVLLNRDSFELSDFVEGKWGANDIKFWDLPEESVKYYACPDTDSALGLYNYAVQHNLFDKYGMRKTYQIEVLFSLCIAYQEFYGHCADVERSEELAKRIEETLEVEYKAMVDMVGYDFNPRSAKDLPKVMYEDLGYPIIARTDTGNPSCGKKVLKALSEKTDLDGNPLYPFVNHLKKWKDNAQLKSNFINKLKELATEDGFMFSSVQQFLETGRVSVSDPNYQSYNDTVKKYIVPRSGFYMLDTDYSSVEYRILASMAGQEKLIEDFKDPDVDYHAYQASRMFGVPYELVTKTLRSQAKGINFGLPYGMGDPKLGESIFGAKTPENTMKAKKLRKLYFEGQEKIEQFFIDARRNGVEKSYSDTYFGRRRYFDRRVKDRGSIEREAGNNRIQGTAADIYKISMVRLFTEIRKRGWLGKVLLSAFVHDECVLEVHKSIDPAVMLKVLRECLMLKIPGWCPLYIGAGFGTNWYDAKKTEIPVQVQETIEEQWGDSGLDWWDGDTEKLFYWEVGMINDYKRDRVLNFLKNKENWGKVLPPVENAFAHEVLEEISIGRHVDGVVFKDAEPKKDTIDNLKEFCRVFGEDDLYVKANIQKPVYKESDNKNVLKNTDEDEIEEVSLFDTIMMKVRELGIGLDVNSKKVYFRYDDNDIPLMNIIHGIMIKNPGTFEVLAVKSDGAIFSTGLKLDLKAYSNILSSYISRRNQMRGII